MALFGCAPKRPLDYSGSAGLLWAINGGRLVELHRDWAVIELAANGSRAGKVTLPWIGRGRRPGERGGLPWGWPGRGCGSGEPLTKGGGGKGGDLIVRPIPPPSTAIGRAALGNMRPVVVR